MSPHLLSIIHFTIAQPCEVSVFLIPLLQKRELSLNTCPSPRGQEVVGLRFEHKSIQSPNVYCLVSWAQVLKKNGYISWELTGSGHYTVVSASIISFNLPKSTTFCSRYCSYPTFINEETETPRGCLNLSKVTPFMRELTQAIWFQMPGYILYIKLLPKIRIQ